jgi:acetyltransferase-like isoleucine patch superfamily enzyme
VAQFLEHDWYPEPLPDNVRIGKRSWIYSSYAFRHYRSRREIGLRIGRDSGVYIGSMFEIGPEGEVDIGDYCTLVSTIIASNIKVVINDYAFIAHDVVIADSFAPVPPDAIPWRAVPFESIVIGENAWIGARAVILGGARIGENAIVGAAAVVDFDVPAGCVVAGNPARIVSRNK